MKKVDLFKKIEDLNKVILDVNREGYTFKTNYAYMQEAFDRLLIPVGMKNSGTIRTLNQVNDFLLKRFGEKAVPLSYKEYKKEVMNLLKSLSSVDTKEKFYESKRTEYIENITSSLAYSSEFLSNIPTEELRDILNEAWRRTKNDSKGSPTFQDHLIEVIREEI